MVLVTKYSITKSTYVEEQVKSTQIFFYKDYNKNKILTMEIYYSISSEIGFNKEDSEYTQGNFLITDGNVKVRYDNEDKYSEKKISQIPEEIKNKAFVSVIYDESTTFTNANAVFVETGNDLQINYDNDNYILTIKDSQDMPQKHIELYIHYDNMDIENEDGDVIFEAYQTRLLKTDNNGEIILDKMFIDDTDSFVIRFYGNKTFNPFRQEVEL